MGREVRERKRGGREGKSMSERKRGEEREGERE